MKMKTRTVLTLVPVFCLALGIATPAEAGLGKLWPFASKKHIKNRIDPLTGRISEMEEVNKEQAARIKEIDERTQAELLKATEQVNAADSKAQLAGKTASEADQTAREAQTQISSVQSDVEHRFSELDNFQTVKTLSIGFKRDQALLDSEDKAALDELAGELKDHKGYVLEVEGYTDTRGSQQYNLELSRKRADSVVRYLVSQHQIPLFRLRTVGMGQTKAALDENGKPVPGSSRKVEIRLLSNNSMQMAAK
jgi:outer membrane protein OmpA-like peptidoglycan-associated protein